VTFRMCESLKSTAMEYDRAAALGAAKIHLRKQEAVCYTPLPQNLTNHKKVMKIDRLLSHTPCESMHITETALHNLLQVQCHYK